MAQCQHTDLELLGTEKSDVGQNKYMKCKLCGEVIVVTAEGKVFGIKPDMGSAEPSQKGGRTHSE